MKELPNRFPIRYAIIVQEHQRKRDNEYFSDAHRQVLWEQLLRLLQNKPLSLSDLTVSYQYVGYSYGDTKLCHIPVLNAEKGWRESAEKLLSQIVQVGTFSSSSGQAFRLGLISYRGMGEQPLFWKIYAARKKGDAEASLLGLFSEGYMTNVKEYGEVLYKKYRELMDGEDSKKLSNDSDILQITVPYSNLWKNLDAGKNDGYIPTDAEKANVSEQKTNTSKHRSDPEKIKIILAKNLDALLTEEMRALRNMARSCNNCDKALPFNYQGKYCRDLPENRECLKERARLRARRQ